ncbi:MAG: hypothetical protein J0L92_03470 [Deltaproteobacteria bacterium]|nr:hypothetical protein [Deltaproteobacteria bacterium]
MVEVSVAALTGVKLKIREADPPILAEIRADRAGSAPPAIVEKVRGSARVSDDISRRHDGDDDLLARAASMLRAVGQEGLAEAVERARAH